MPDTRPDLREILTDAIGFARAHGVDPFTVDDFALQRSEADTTHATYAYADSDHLVNVHVDRDGKPTYAVAELAWVHDDADPDRDLCDYCEVIGHDATGEFDDDGDDDAEPFVDLYLPGDAPANTVPPTPEQLAEALEATAVRDPNGAIRRRDGTYIADADVTAEQLEAKIAEHGHGGTARARYLCKNYRLALELLGQEIAEAGHANLVDDIREHLDLDAGLTAIIGEAVPGE